MGTGESNALNAVDRPEFAQQVRKEGCSLRDIAPVGVDVLAEHGDLTHARLRQHRRLAHQVLEWSADLFATHRGNNAVRTRVVTAGLDRHPRGEGKFAHRIERGGHVAVRFGVGGVEHFHQWPLHARATK